MRSSGLPLALAIAMAIAPAITLAQDPSPNPAPPSVPPETLEVPLPPPALEREPLPEPDDEREEPVLRSPTARAPSSDHELEAYEETLPPTQPALPEFRVRAAGGVTLPTSGATVPFARLSQEVEWQPASLEFLGFGIGVGESIGPLTLVQVGARVLGFAWFCTDRVVQCQGAIGVQFGVIAGGYGAHFDLSADVDLRFLFAERIELFARGGFFSVSINSFLNLSGGLAVAF